VRQGEAEEAGVVPKRDKEDDGMDPSVVQDLYDLLVDVTSPEVTERLRVAGFDMEDVGLSRDGATAAWLLDWLSKRGSIDVISDAGGYTVWFQRGEKFIRASARTKSDTYAELVLMVSAEGDGTAASG
jgi:hypothetical protein